MRSLSAAFSIIMIGAMVLVVSGANAEQKGTPYCGRTNPSRYREVDYGGGNIYEMTLLESKTVGTNILYIKRGIIPARAGIGVHTHKEMEEMYFVFNAPAEFTVDGHTSLLPANTCVLCPLGSSHALYNNSDKTLEFLTIAVTKVKDKGDENIKYGEVPKRAKLETPTVFRWANFDRSLTKLVGPAHIGKGKILNRRPWLDGNFETNWVRVGHCILPPDTSIGYHQHKGMEEVYYVMKGTGRMTVNDHTWDVMPGDATPCSIHDSHGIYNNSDEDLEIFVLMVSMEKDKLDSKNWGDDLSNR
ncbi:cupin domain-containing protein [Candidatus Latescibacterota bacterium]